MSQRCIFLQNGSKSQKQKTLQEEKMPDVAKIQFFSTFAVACLYDCVRARTLFAQI